MSEKPKSVKLTSRKLRELSRGDADAVRGGITVALGELMNYILVGCFCAIVVKLSAQTWPALFDTIFQHIEGIIFNI